MARSRWRTPAPILIAECEHQAQVFAGIDLRDQPMRHGIGDLRRQEMGAERSGSAEIIVLDGCRRGAADVLHAAQIVSTHSLSGWAAPFMAKWPLPLPASQKA
jgi:hypothetical protein